MVRGNCRTARDAELGLGLDPVRMWTNTLHGPRRTGQSELVIQGQSGVCAEFKGSQGCTARPCLRHKSELMASTKMVASLLGCVVVLAFRPCLFWA